MHGILTYDIFAQQEVCFTHFDNLELVLVGVFRTKTPSTINYSRGSCVRYRDYGQLTFRKRDSHLDRFQWTNSRFGEIEYLFDKRESKKQENQQYMSDSIAFGIKVWNGLFKMKRFEIRLFWQFVRLAGEVQ